MTTRNTTLKRLRRKRSVMENHYFRRSIGDIFEPIPGTKLLPSIKENESMKSCTKFSKKFYISRTGYNGLIL